MKKIILILILITFQIYSFGQVKMFWYQPYNGQAICLKTNMTEINSLSQLPTKINYIINELLKKSMTDFVQNIKFAKGYEIDIDMLLNNDSLVQNQYQGIIPKYNLIFELKDTLTKINNYGLEIDLDQYGQIINFNWPRKDYNKRTNFCDIKLIKDIALKYAKKKKYKTEESLYELKYNNSLQKLSWCISFYQYSTIGNKSSYKEYKSIIIDAFTMTILSEENMTTGGND